MGNPRLRLLFLGSDHFSLPILRRLIKASIHEIDINTKPDTFVDGWAKQEKLNVKYWPVEKRHYDIGLVASFGKLIDEDTINLCEKGMYNIHPSLLPRWRGSTPIARCIEHGDKQTGVTVMRVRPYKFDIGEILMQNVVNLEARETYPAILKRLALIASDMTETFLADPDTYIRQAVPQSESGKTLARKLTPECGRLDFHTSDSYMIDRKVRAYDTLINTYSHWIDGKRLILSDSQDPNVVNSLELDLLAQRLYPHLYSGMDLSPGHVIYHKRRKWFCVKCANNTWSAFIRVSLEFKQVMTAEEFYNGYLSKLSRDQRVILKSCL